MTLQLTKDKGAEFCLTICNSCGQDSPSSQDNLSIAGWTWDHYADNSEWHLCPECTDQGRQEEERHYIADEMQQEAEWLERMER